MFSIIFIEFSISSLDISPFDKGIIPVFFQQLKIIVGVTLSQALAA
jgi:hypothetical protein